MSTFVPVAKAGELTDGTMKEVTVQGRNILLARVGDRYYAADGRCPHMGGILAQGKLEGTVVTCPRHSSQFDLTDGHVIRWTDWMGLKAAVAKIVKSPRPLTVHQVKVEKDDILVEV
jgi:3-phenylpropionate/trans-cinnamate dioxygenase ferredoxin subunit